MNEKMLEMTMISLDDGVVMPELSFYLDATTREACEAVGHAVKNEECIFLANPVHKNGDKTVSFYEIGVIARIKQFVRLQNKGMRVLIQTEKRARLVDYSKDKYYVCHVTDVEETNDISEDEEKAIQSILKEKLKEAFDEGIVKNNVLYREIRSFKSVRKLVDSMADYVNISDDNRQELLEMLDVRSRAMRLIQIMEEVLGIGKIKKEIMEKVNQETAENQRKYVLREQMSVIRKELGDDGVDANVREFQKRLDEAGCSQKVYDKIEKEINYYKGIPQNAVESSVSANYIDVMLSYPWNVSTEDNNDLQSAIDILDKDHYGLEEVKERIVDYLAVHILSNKGDLPIICLVGPPGTGKTSIAKSLARALKKPYVRISLGGVRDEAEIRGHRKTYVGAMPGRIATALRTAGVKNPLLLLDEIDKVSNDYKGDTFSALLEVLDSEQNKKFRDHYLEVPLDLSGVLFVTTANTLQTIPRPLLDRMEVIEINSYTENEKLHIATEHLIPKQLEKHGLKSEQLTISKKAIWKIARNYTKEAGVRQLERKIGDICRKSAREILEEKKKTIHVTERNLHLYLGKELYIYQMKNEQDEVGIVRGLAWTSVGGDTLEIEVNVMPGEGEILLTGQLGDVMKESARTGISYIRSVSKEYGIDEKFFKEHDIHIHIPEGATPKDGPSAGITMATAMLSAITEKKVRADIAMTGEITLRGRVLPIGGLKEKLLAAKNAGIKTVLVPKENETDVEEISAEITKGLEILPVSHMSEVLKHALIF